jgi:hypothetical protein
MSCRERVFSIEISFIVITGFDIKIKNQRIQTTCLHASLFVIYGNVDFVLTVPHATLMLFLSHIHVNSIKLLKIICILVATKCDITKFRVYMAPLWALPTWQNHKVISMPSNLVCDLKWAFEKRSGCVVKLK